MRMKQVLVIPGGNSFSDYGEFLRYLQQRPVDLEFSNKKDWKATLGERLGDGYQVILPRMPNRDNALYEEWKIWFEKHLELFGNEVILIGHSLGGCFLAKYLSTEKVSRRVLATLIVAAPFDAGARDSAEFVVQSPLTRLAEQGGAVHLYFSTDDTIVPYNELEKYKEALPDAFAHSFSDYGHFNTEEFPELVADIKSL